MCVFVFVITLQHCCTLVNLLHQWWVLFHLSPTCDPAAFAPKPLCLFSTFCHRVVHNPFAVICICPAPPTNRLYWVPYMLLHYCRMLLAAITVVGTFIVATATACIQFEWVCHCCWHFCVICIWQTWQIVLF